MRRPKHDVNDLRVSRHDFGKCFDGVLDALVRRQQTESEQHHLAFNAKAVFEALIGHETAFARTPKFGLAGKGVVKGRQQAQQRAKYRRRSGLLPYAEIAMGVFFLAMVLYAFETYNFMAVPFLTLFVGGYFWAGFSTLWEEYRSKLAWERQQALARQEN